MVDSGGLLVVEIHGYIGGSELRIRLEAEFSGVSAGKLVHGGIDPSHLIPVGIQKDDLQGDLVEGLAGGVFHFVAEDDAEEPRVFTYDFDLGASTTLTGFAGKALSNNHASGKKISEVLKDYYADGTLNWSVEALADGLKESEAMFRAAPQGWRITAEDGEWLALRIKNPGAGTYDLSLKRGATYALLIGFSIMLIIDFYFG